DTASGTALAGFGVSPATSFNNSYFLSSLNLSTASVSVTTASLADRVIFGLQPDLTAGANTLGSVSVNTSGGNDIASVANSTAGSVTVLVGDGKDGSGIFNDTLGSL